MIAWLEKIAKLVNRMLSVLSIIVFIGVVLITAAQVVTRYIFKTPIASSEELSRIFFIWISLLGAAMVMKDNEHIRLDVIKTYLSEKGQIILELCIQLMLLVFDVVLVSRGIHLMTITTRQVTSVTRISMSYIYSVIPISFAIMALFGLVIIAKLIVQWRSVGQKQKEGKKS